LARYIFIGPSGGLEHWMIDAELMTVTQVHDLLETQFRLVGTHQFKHFFQLGTV
jgi:hypothetical protein